VTTLNDVSAGRDGSSSAAAFLRRPQIVQPVRPALERHIDAAVTCRSGWARELKGPPIVLLSYRQAACHHCYVAVQRASAGSPFTTSAALTSSPPCSA